MASLLVLTALFSMFY